MTTQIPVAWSRTCEAKAYRKAAEEVAAMASLADLAVTEGLVVAKVIAFLRARANIIGKEQS